MNIYISRGIDEGIKRVVKKYPMAVPNPHYPTSSQGQDWFKGLSIGMMLAEHSLKILRDCENDFDYDAKSIKRAKNALM